MSDIQELQAQLDTIDAELRRLLTSETVGGVPLAVRVSELIEQSRTGYALLIQARAEQSAEDVFQSLEGEYLDLCRTEGALKELEQLADNLKARIREASGQLKQSRQVLASSTEDRLVRAGGGPEVRERWQAVVVRGNAIVRGEA